MHPFNSVYPVHPPHPLQTDLPTDPASRLPCCWRCSFVGIITVISSRVARKIDLSLAFLFASGALLTTAVVHIIPDAMDSLAAEYGAEDGDDDDGGGDGHLHDLFLHSSIAVMAGIFGGFLLHVVLDTGNGHSHSSSAKAAAAAAALLLHPPAAGRPPCGDTCAATPPVSEEASLANSVAENGNPAGATATARAPAAATTPVAINAPTSSLSDSYARGGGGGGRTVAATTTCSGSQGTRNDDCTQVAHSRGYERNGDDLEEGGRQGQRQEQRQQRQQQPSDHSEAENRARKPASTTASPSYPANPPGGEAGAVFTGGLAASSLNDARRLGAQRGLFDLAGLDPVCWNVILGDLAHNFSDGVTMGAAFLGCSPTVGWTITAANMMHEIPHEVGSFMALVNGGMSSKQVCVCVLCV